MIPLEDNAADIIGKAQRGLGISDSELAEKARVSSQKIRALRGGEFDELTLLRIAGILGLAMGGDQSSICVLRMTGGNTLGDDPARRVLPKMDHLGA